MSQTNDFARWSALGYKRLLPIVPPSAGELGQRKMPGVRDEYGNWRGIKDWNHYHAANIELDRWGEMGASVGLLATEDAFALDVDAHDPNVALQIETMARMLLGPAPKRVGRAPKFALLYRTSEPLKPQILRFDAPPEREGRPDRVEIPTQLVIDGLHPVTQQPYSWPSPAGPASELTCVSAEQLAGFFSVLRGVLPITASLSTSVDRETTAQEELRGEPDLVAKAVASIPNSPDIRYEEWVRIAAAIRAALPDDQELGLELFKEFSDRTSLPERSEDEERVYWSVLPPFGVGADYLYTLAARTSTFAAERWYEELPAQESAPTEQPSTGLYEFLSMEDILNLPPLRYIYARHIPENSLGFLYGTSGTGKSFIALDWALHMAYERQECRNDAMLPGAVLYIAGEGIQGMQQRVKAWMEANDAPGPAPRGRFNLMHEATNFMKPDDVGRISKTIRAKIPDPLALIIVDTVSRVLPGADENLQKEMTLFVAACDALRRAHKCVVLGVHHAGKNGDIRGSTVLRAAGDFVFKLKREEGSQIGELWCDKQKDGRDGWCDRLAFVEIGQSLVIRRPGEGAAVETWFEDVGEVALDQA